MLFRSYLSSKKIEYIDFSETQDFKKFIFHAGFLESIGNPSQERRKRISWEDSEGGFQGISHVPHVKGHGFRPEQRD